MPRSHHITRLRGRSLGQSPEPPLALLAHQEPLHGSGVTHPGWVSVLTAQGKFLGVAGLLGGEDGAGGCSPDPWGVGLAGAGLRCLVMSCVGSLQVGTPPLPAPLAEPGSRRLCPSSSSSSSYSSFSSWERCQAVGPKTGLEKDLPAPRSRSGFPYLFLMFNMLGEFAKCCGSLCGLFGGWDHPCAHQAVPRSPAPAPTLNQGGRRGGSHPVLHLVFNYVKSCLPLFALEMLSAARAFAPLPSCSDASTQGAVTPLPAASPLETPRSYTKGVLNPRGL